MGWEPATTYSHDSDGRLASSKLEVEWDETERQWMQALAHHREETLCPLCGLPKTICRAKTTDGAVSVEFERCHVTAALAAKQREVSDSEERYPESLLYSAGLKRPSG